MFNIFNKVKKNTLVTYFTDKNMNGIIVALNGDRLYEGSFEKFKNKDKNGNTILPAPWETDYSDWETAFGYGVWKYTDDRTIVNDQGYTVVFDS